MNKYTHFSGCFPNFMDTPDACSHKKRLYNHYHDSSERHHLTFDRLAAYCSYDSIVTPPAQDSGISDSALPLTTTGFHGLNLQISNASLVPGDRHHNPLSAQMLWKLDGGFWRYQFFA
ncbi:hypothetical protein ACFL0H_00540 [Thermodesulfobacteriota bacterium]